MNSANRLYFLLLTTVISIITSPALASDAPVKMVGERVECSEQQTFDGRTTPRSYRDQKVFDIVLSSSNTKNCTGNFNGKCDFVTPKEINDLLNQGYSIDKISFSSPEVGYLRGDIPVFAGFQSGGPSPTDMIYFSFRGIAPGEANLDWNKIVSTTSFTMKIAFIANKDGCPLWN